MENASKRRKERDATAHQNGTTGCLEGEHRVTANRASM